MANLEKFDSIFLINNILVKILKPGDIKKTSSGLLVFEKNHEDDAKLAIYGYVLKKADRIFEEDDEARIINQLIDIGDIVYLDRYNNMTILHEDKDGYIVFCPLYSVIGIRKLDDFSLAAEEGADIEEL